ncbi:uncharacterized protein LOC128393357 [Panonychus citri]|uniref:uncharacterized protein LOC128393357 n=1 Tax=Panonychus citri TaxID=50023 RepID=UPI0023082E94|nr:uncharacterized protein LOC128393357 [Panonychus citri]
MNSIVLISLLCLSVTSSASHLGHFHENQISLFNKDAPGPIGDLIIKVVTSLVVQSEQLFPGWNETKSLEENLENIIDAPLRVDGVPAWDPDATVEENLVAGISFLLTIIPLPENDRSKTIAENVANLINDAFALIPFPAIPIVITRQQVKQKVTDLIKQILAYIPGLDVNKTLQANVRSYVKEILKIAKGIDSSKTLIENINIAIETTLDQIKLSGFNPDKTLDANVIDVLTDFFTRLPF